MKLYDNIKVLVTVNIWTNVETYITEILMHNFSFNSYIELGEKA